MNQADIFARIDAEAIARDKRCYPSGHPPYNAPVADPAFDPYKWADSLPMDYNFDQPLALTRSAAKAKPGSVLMNKPPITIKIRTEQGLFEAESGRISAVAGTARAAANLVAKRYFEKDLFALKETPAGFTAAASIQEGLFE